MKAKKLVQSKQKKIESKPKHLCFVQFNTLTCISESKLSDILMSGYWTTNGVWETTSLHEATVYTVLDSNDLIDSLLGLDPRDNTRLYCDDRKSVLSIDNPDQISKEESEKMKTLCESLVNPTSASPSVPDLGTGGGLGGHNSGFVKETKAWIDSQIESCPTQGFAPPDKGFFSPSPGREKDPIIKFLIGDDNPLSSKAKIEISPSSFIAAIAAGIAGGAVLANTLTTMKSTEHREAHAKAQTERDARLDAKNEKKLDLEIKKLELDITKVALEIAKLKNDDPRKKELEDKQAKLKKEKEQKEKERKEKEKKKAEEAAKDKKNKKQTLGDGGDVCENSKNMWSDLKETCDQNNNWDRPGTICNDLLVHVNGCINPLVVNIGPEGDNTCRRSAEIDTSFLKQQCKNQGEIALEMGTIFDPSICDLIGTAEERFGNRNNLCTDPRARPTEGTVVKVNLSTMELF